MSTPRRSATSISVSPGSACTSSPFSLKAMSSWARAVSFIVLIHFLREIFDDTCDGIGRRLAEAADGRVHHRLRKVGEQRLVPPRLAHQHRRLVGADAARRALAAGL